jgi:hypothetical protein
VLAVPLSEIKHIAYVRDFNLNDSVNPERLTRRTFLARPRTEGLWVRLSFRGQSTPSNEPDQLEGLAPLDATAPRSRSSSCSPSLRLHPARSRGRGLRRSLSRKNSSALFPPTRSLTRVYRLIPT